MERPDLLPATAGLIEAMDVSERACAILDYMAGMTDRYAAEQFLRQFFPRNWSGEPMAAIV